MRKLSILSSFLLALAGPVANATLIDQGSTTRDSVSGLEWLDLTETRSLSYDYVSQQLGIGGAFEGWRYANLTETQNLFLQAGFTIDSAYGSMSAAPAGFESALYYLVGLLGDTLRPFDLRYTGILGIIDFSTAVDYHLRLGAYSYQSGAAYKVRTDSSCCSVYDADSFAYNGHFLVRSVTVAEPGTLLLLLTCLSAGLLRYRRHPR